jgi:SAM-dependent methyltransferase
MGDVNQLAFVAARKEALAAPFLEVGSRDYGSTPDLAALFPGRRYVRVDATAGQRVDVVLDLTAPFEVVDAALGGARFGTIFCLSVLEHCADPFQMARNLEALLAPGGRVVVSVPFAWQFHGYPSDYWRFTHEGVGRLFPGLVFDDPGDGWTGPGRAAPRPFDADVGQVGLTGGWHRKRGRPLRALSAGALRLLARLGPLRWLAGNRYVLAPTMIHRVGRRPDSGRGGAKRAEIVPDPDQRR